MADRVADNPSMDITCTIFGEPQTKESVMSNTMKPYLWIVLVILAALGLAFWLEMRES